MVNIEPHIIQQGLCEALLRVFQPTASFMDSDNMVWKIINGELVGKRSVWTIDNRACWLEDTKKEDVKTWWCGGVNANYEEAFYKKEFYK